jgi:hypothetical protein
VEKVADSYGVGDIYWGIFGTTAAPTQTRATPSGKTGGPPVAGSLDIKSKLN